MKTRVLFVALSFMLTAVLPASANLIVNGSFELGTPNDNPQGFTTLGAGSGALTGWTIGPQGIDWIGSYWQPGDGTRSVDLSGNGPGSISQTFATVAGQTYQVSFLLAGNPDGPPPTKTMDVSGTDFSQSFPFPLGSNTRADMGWTPFSFFFVASGGLETITFGSNLDLNSTAFGPALDLVNVSAVPELSTWLMMLLGFATLAYFARRRSLQQLPTAA
jgi:choice-of-anchor C domain-containing protein